MVSWSADDLFLFTSESLRKQTREAPCVSSCVRVWSLPLPGGAAAAPFAAVAPATAQAGMPMRAEAAGGRPSSLPRTATLLHTLQSGGSHEVFVLQPHPLDSSVLATAGYDGYVRLWDAYKGTSLGSLRSPTHVPDEPMSKGEELLDAAWSADGTCLAASNYDAELILFGSVGAHPGLQRAPPHQFFGPDGHALVHDAHHNALDAHANLQPHRVPRGPLCDAELIALPAEFQRAPRKGALEPPGLHSEQRALEQQARAEVEAEEAEERHGRQLRAQTGGGGGGSGAAGKQKVGTAAGKQAAVHTLATTRGTSKGGGGHGGSGRHRGGASAVASGDPSPPTRVVMGGPRRERHRAASDANALRFLAGGSATSGFGSAGAAQRAAAAAANAQTASSRAAAAAAASALAFHVADSDDDDRMPFDGDADAGSDYEEEPRGGRRRSGRVGDSDDDDDDDEEDDDLYDQLDPEDHAIAERGGRDGRRLGRRLRRGAPSPSSRGSRGVGTRASRAARRSSSAGPRRRAGASSERRVSGRATRAARVRARRRRRDSDDSDDDDEEEDEFEYGSLGSSEEEEEDDEDEDEEDEDESEEDEAEQQRRKRRREAGGGRSDLKRPRGEGSSNSGGGKGGGEASGGGGGKGEGVSPGWMADPLGWLLRTEQSSTEFVPQLGDAVTYLRRGHEEALSLYADHEGLPPPPFVAHPNLPCAVACTVTAVRYVPPKPLEQPPLGRLHVTLQVDGSVGDGSAGDGSAGDGSAGDGPTGASTDQSPPGGDLGAFLGRELIDDKAALGVGGGSTAPVAHDGEPAGGSSGGPAASAHEEWVVTVPPPAAGCADFLVLTARYAHAARQWEHCLAASRDGTSLAINAWFLNECGVYEWFSGTVLSVRPTKHDLWESLSVSWEDEPGEAPAATAPAATAPAATAPDPPATALAAVLDAPVDTPATAATDLSAAAGGGGGEGGCGGSEGGGGGEGSGGEGGCGGGTSGVAGEGSSSTALVVAEEGEAEGEGGAAAGGLPAPACESGVSEVLSPWDVEVRGAQRFQPPCVSDSLSIPIVNALDQLSRTQGFSLFEAAAAAYVAPPAAAGSKRDRDRAPSRPARPSSAAATAASKSSALPVQAATALPVDLKLVLGRLRDGYYRQWAALPHDLELLLSRYAQPRHSRPPRGDAVAAMAFEAEGALACLAAALRPCLLAAASEDAEERRSWQRLYEEHLAGPAASASGELAEAMATAQKLLPRASGGRDAADDSGDDDGLSEGGGGGGDGRMARANGQHASSSSRRGAGASLSHGKRAMSTADSASAAAHDGDRPKRKRRAVIDDDDDDDDGDDGDDGGGGGVGTSAARAEAAAAAAAAAAEARERDAAAKAREERLRAREGRGGNGAADTSSAAAGGSIGGGGSSATHSEASHLKIRIPIPPEFQRHASQQRSRPAVPSGRAVRAARGGAGETKVATEEEEEEEDEAAEEEAPPEESQRARRQRGRR